jgi:hypothetical protein
MAYGNEVSAALQLSTVEIVDMTGASDRHVAGQLLPATLICSLALFLSIRCSAVLSLFLGLHCLWSACTVRTTQRRVRPRQYGSCLFLTEDWAIEPGVSVSE